MKYSHLLKIPPTVILESIKSFSVNRKKETLVSSNLSHAIKHPLNIPGFLLEGALIAPIYFPLLQAPIEMAKTIKTFRPDINPSDYIKLGRFVKMENMFSIGCDWCSVVNGSIEMIVEAFKQSSAEDILKMNSFFFKAPLLTLRPLRYAKGSAAFRCKKPTEKDVLEFLDTSCSGLSEEDKMKLYSFAYDVLDIQTIAAHVESRWCPFEYIRTMAYKRDYWSKDLQGVVSEIVRHGRVKCSNCIDIANNAPGVQNPKYKLFEDYINTIYAA